MLEQITSGEQKIDRLEEMKRIVAGANKAIEREFSRSANSWLECFGSVIFQLECYTFSEVAKKELGEDKYQGIIIQLEELKERLADYKRQYPDREDIPSEQVKEELLGLIKKIAK